MESKTNIAIEMSDMVVYCQSIKNRDQKEKSTFGKYVISRTLHKRNMKKI